MKASTGTATGWQSPSGTSTPGTREHPFPSPRMQMGEHLAAGRLVKIAPSEANTGTGAQPRCRVVSLWGFVVFNYFFFFRCSFACCTLPSCCFLSSVTAGLWRCPHPSRAKQPVATGRCPWQALNYPCKLLCWQDQGCAQGLGLLASRGTKAGVPGGAPKCSRGICAILSCSLQRVWGEEQWVGKEICGLGDWSRVAVGAELLPWVFLQPWVNPSVSSHLVLLPVQWGCQHNPTPGIL